MKKITLTFEVPKATTVEELHELMCKVVHEGDQEAWTELQAMVADIDTVEETAR